MRRLGHKPLAAVLACVAAAFVLIAAADAADRSGIDQKLAYALVVAPSDLPTGLTTPYSDGIPNIVLQRCLSRTGFRVTAWAGSPTYGAQNFSGFSVAAVATVLETTSSAKRYYRFATRKLRSNCIPQYWRQIPGTPPTVGHVRKLPLPRFGAQSEAWRLPVGWPGEGRGAQFNSDFIVVREGRAVLVDDPLFWRDWPAQDPDHSGLTVDGVERNAIGGQLARSTGNGAIAFSTSGALVAVNPYSLRRRTLDRCSTSCSIGDPHWSPDGTRIAFVRGNPPPADGDPPTGWSLYVASARGTHARPLAACGDCGVPGFDRRIGWSPNGKWIVFSRTDAPRQDWKGWLAESLWVVAAGGGKPRRLTRCHVWCADVRPVWSPNGRRLIFQRITAGNPPLGVNRLYTVRPDGSGLRRIGRGLEPQWSPDGRRIVFIDNESRTSGSIAIADADGSHLRELFTGADPGVPSWSPDGRKLLFFNAPELNNNLLVEVWTMNPDGTQQKRLYRSGCCDGVGAAGPTWSPDGSMIAFAAATGGGTFVMKADGTGLRQLASTVPPFGASLSWQSLPK